LPKAKKLKLALTAGIGSDHIDLETAIKHGVTVAEMTRSNSISVAEHAVMMILALVSNYIPAHEWVEKGGWNIADCVERFGELLDRMSLIGAKGDNIVQNHIVQNRSVRRCCDHASGNVLGICAKESVVG
jgi:lactate dehydrogenase-like 2-hydroxyacid dehydrogenase